MTSQVLSIYIDIDGTVRDLVGAIDRLYLEQFPGDELGNTNVYDLSLRYPRWGEDIWDIVFREHVDRLFLHDAEPYEDAIETVNWLHNQRNTVVQFLSKQDSLRSKITDEWLAAQGVDDTIERLYVDGMSKGEFLTDRDDERFTLVIDDSSDELISINHTVTYRILIARPWNAAFREGWEEAGGWVIDNLTQEALEGLLSPMRKTMRRIGRANTRH